MYTRPYFSSKSRHEIKNPFIVFPTFKFMIEIKIIGTFTKLAAKIREFPDKPANSN